MGTPTTLGAAAKRTEVAATMGETVTVTAAPPKIAFGASRPNVVVEARVVFVVDASS